MEYRVSDGLEVGSALRADLTRSPNGERKAGARFIVHSFAEGAA
jgi:hypothetical protein